MFNKQDIFKSVALIWFMGSSVYIGYDIWNEYMIKGIQLAYQSGIEDATKQLFEKSKAGQCKEAVSVTLGQDKMDLVDVKCLQQPQAATGAQQEIKAQPPTTLKK